MGGLTVTLRLLVLLKLFLMLLCRLSDVLLVSLDRKVSGRHSPALRQQQHSIPAIALRSSALPRE